MDRHSLLAPTYRFACPECEVAMKNYKFLVPVVLIVLYAASIYMLNDTKTKEMNQYNASLSMAREYREMGIQVDAETYYMQALEQNPSIDLYMEIGEFYWASQQKKEAEEWGNAIIEAYPQEVRGYEFLMGVYEQREDYVACFDLADTLTKRKMNSPVISEILSRIEYYFYFTGGYEDTGICSGGLIPVATEGKWGYVTQNGGKAVPLTYAYAGPFSEGIAPVIDREGNAYFIDAEGNKKHVVLGVDNVQQLGLMERGMFSLYDGAKWSFYNTEHEKVFGDYDEVSSIGNGIAAVKENGKWHLVDRNGTDLTGKTYHAVAMDEKLVIFRNERLFVSNGEYYQMITSSGEVIGDGRYEDVHIFGDTTYAAVKVNGKWGFVDKDGNMVIEPQYEDARSFSNGLAAVMLNDLWGFIDSSGKVVIAPQFEKAWDFNSDGCVFVFIDSEWKLLRLFKLNH